MAPRKRPAKAAKTVPSNNDLDWMPDEEVTQAAKNTGASNATDLQSTSPSRRQALGATGANTSISTPHKITRRTTRSRAADGSPLLTLEAVDALKPKPRGLAAKSKAESNTLQSFADSLELDLQQEVNEDAVDTQDSDQAHDVPDLMNTDAPLFEKGNADIDMEGSLLTQTDIASNKAEVAATMRAAQSNAIGYKATEEVVKHDGEYDAADSHSIIRNSPYGPVVRSPSPPKGMAAIPQGEFLETTRVQTNQFSIQYPGDLKSTGSDTNPTSPVNHQSGFQYPSDSKSTGSEIERTSLIAHQFDSQHPGDSESTGSGSEIERTSLIAHQFDIQHPGDSESTGSEIERTSLIARQFGIHNSGDSAKSTGFEIGIHNSGNSAKSTGFEIGIHNSGDSVKSTEFEIGLQNLGDSQSTGSEIGIHNPGDSVKSTGFEIEPTPPLAHQFDIYNSGDSAKSTGSEIGIHSPGDSAKSTGFEIEPTPPLAHQFDIYYPGDSAKSTGSEIGIHYPGDSVKSTGSEIKPPPPVAHQFDIFNSGDSAKSTGYETDFTQPTTPSCALLSSPPVTRLSTPTPVPGVIRADLPAIPFALATPNLPALVRKHNPARFATPLLQHKPWIIPAPVGHFGPKPEETKASTVHNNLAMGDTIDLPKKFLSLPLSFDSASHYDSPVHASPKMPVVGGTTHSIHIPVICQNAENAALIQRMFQDGNIVLTDDAVFALVNMSKRVKPASSKEQRRTRKGNVRRFAPTTEPECRESASFEKLKPLGHDLMKDAGDERWISGHPMSQQEYGKSVDDVMDIEIEKIDAEMPNIGAENPSPIEEAEVIDGGDRTPSTPVVASTRPRPTSGLLSPRIFSVPGSIARNLVGSISRFGGMLSPSKRGSTAPEVSGTSSNVQESPAEVVVLNTSHKRASSQMDADKEHQPPRKRTRNLQPQERTATLQEEHELSQPILRKVKVIIKEDFDDPETGEPKLTAIYMTERGYQGLMYEVNKRPRTKKTYTNGPGTYGLTDALLDDSDSDVEPTPTRADIEKFKRYVVEFDSPLGQVGVFNKSSPPISVGLREGKPSGRKRYPRASKKPHASKVVKGPAYTAPAKTDKTEIPAQTAAAPAAVPHTPESSGPLKRKLLLTYPKPENGGYGFSYGSAFVIGVDYPGEGLSEDEDEAGSPLKKRKVSEHQLTPHPQKISSNQFIGVNGIAPPQFLTKEFTPDPETAPTPPMPIAQPTATAPIPSSDLPKQASKAVNVQSKDAPGDKARPAIVALDKARKGAEQYKPTTPSGLRRVSIVSTSSASVSPVPSRQMSGSTTFIASPMAATDAEANDSDLSFDSLFDDPEDYSSRRKLSSPSQKVVASNERLETPTRQASVSVQFDTKEPEGMGEENETTASVTSLQCGESDDSIDLDLDVDSTSGHYKFPELPADADPVKKFGLVLKSEQATHPSKAVDRTHRRFRLPDIDFTED